MWIKKNYRNKNKINPIYLKSVYENYMKCESNGFYFKFKDLLGFCRDNSSTKKRIAHFAGRYAKIPLQAITGGPSGKKPNEKSKSIHKEFQISFWVIGLPTDFPKWQIPVEFVGKWGRIIQNTESILMWTNIVRF